MNRVKLRKYQEKHRHLVLVALTGDRDVLYQAPTGAGKSTVMTSVVASLEAHGDWNGVVVTVPMLHIRESFTRNDFATCGMYDCGTYGEGSTKENFMTWMATPAGERSFASVVCNQTFIGADLPEDLEGWVWVVDEAHGSTVDVTEDTPKLSEYRQRWVERGGRLVIVTATPYRTRTSERVYDDTFVEVRRSIAEHSLPDVDGNRYAPMYFEIQAVGLTDYRVRTKNELYGKVAPRSVGAGAASRIVDRWFEDGQPKTIVLVPSGDSKSWGASVVKEFEKRGARVHNAVGPGKVVQNELMELLRSERGVTYYEESTVDVIVACERFNEGTDWPLCSHVYHVGFPRTIGRTNQRWGRSFRSKAHIVGYPEEFLEVACITFFVPELTEKMREEIAQPLFERAHLRMALLMAGHLEDHKAGQLIVSAVRDVVRFNTPVAPVDVTTMEERLKPTDEEMQEIDYVFKFLRPGSDGKLSLAAINVVAERHGLKTTRQRMLFYLRVTSSLKDGSLRERLLEIMDEAYKKAVVVKATNSGGPRQTNPLHLMVSKHFVEAFDLYVTQVHAGKICFEPPMSEHNWKMVCRLTGKTAKEIEASMRRAVREAAKTLAEELKVKPPSFYSVVQVLKKWRKRNWGSPFKINGDISEFFVPPYPPNAYTVKQLREHLKNRALLGQPGEVASLDDLWEMM